MSYAHDVLKLRNGRIDDGALRFSHRPVGRQDTRQPVRR
jgi:monooxygenase